MLPLGSWAVSNGGLPLCCWGKACPMTQHQTCTAMASAPAPGLVLPASLVPVVPMAEAPDGIPTATPLRWLRPDAALLPTAVFRAPLLPPPRA